MLYLKIQVWWPYISNYSKFFKQSDDKICAWMSLNTRTVLNYYILFVCDSPYNKNLNYMYLWTKLSLSAGKMEHLYWRQITWIVDMYDILSFFEIIHVNILQSKDKRRNIIWWYKDHPATIKKHLITLAEIPQPSDDELSLHIIGSLRIQDATLRATSIKNDFIYYHWHTLP